MGDYPFKVRRVLSAGAGGFLWWPDEQVIARGTDHRSQVCTALTPLGMEPPAIDVWDFGELDGRVVEVPPTL
jgi:hypothetical protein